MRRWTTKIFPWIAVAALLLIVARFMLPIMGLAGVEGDLVRPLAKLMPVAITLFLGSVAAIIFDLRRRSKFVVLRPKRLVEEAEGWSDDFLFGEDSPEKALGWQTLSDPAAISKEQKLEARVEEPAAGAVPDQAVIAEPARPLANEILPELERQLEEVFSKRFDPGGGALETRSEEEFSNPLSAYAAPAEPLVEEPRVEESEAERRRVTVEIFPDLDQQEFVSPQVTATGLPARTDSETEEPEEMGKPLTEEVIARYQYLIESARSPAMSLFQLPPPPPEFAGRSFELEDLMAAHANRDLRVLGLQGMGGIGKTTLALKLAERLKKEYADAQFYIDLRGAGSQPLSVAEAQSHIIRAFLPTVRLPESEAELHQLYHSLLQDKRAIVLLDNAANVQQIAPLVAPNGCLTIITSRQHIGLPNSFLRHLEGLPEPEARDLLLRLLPQLGAHAARLAELCGYLPLALRLAAGALLINPELKIEDFIARLDALQQEASAGGRPARQPVDAVLGLGYEQLTPGLQKLWRMLSVFSDTFDLNAAASVWKLQPVRAGNALDRLMAANMIERNRVTGRVRLHDLMAAFAESRLDDDERAVARQRHSAHFQSVLHEADALYEQGGELMKLGLDLVDLEWQNIQAGQVWAATHVDQNRGARELCNSYPDAGKFVLDLRQHPRERIRWSEAALEAAKKMNRHKAAARHLVALGDSYIALSEIHHALEFYEKALEMTRVTRDRRGEAEALSGMGAAHYLGGSLGRARELHKEAMTLFATANDPRGEAGALGNLGFVHYAMGELKQAAHLFERQLKMAREIRDRRNESNALGGLGVASYSMGDARRAAELLNQQMAITREIGDRRGEAGALTNLGNACANLNYAGQAVAYHEQALTVAREIGDRRSEAAALGGLGVSEFLAGNIARSIELLESQRQLTREIGDRRGEAVCLSNMAEAYIAAGNATRAIEMLKQAFNIHGQMGNATGQANSLFNLALALDAIGDRHQAIEQAETAFRLYEIAEHPNMEIVQKKLAEWRGQQ